MDHPITLELGGGDTDAPGAISWATGRAGHSSLQKGKGERAKICISRSEQLQYSVGFYG